MNLGELDIPKIKVEPFLFINDYQTRLFIQYFDIIENTEFGKSLVQILKKDKKVISLSDKMISWGNSAQKFEAKTLAMWYIWSANEFGKETADQYLHGFLESEEIKVINTLWITGIELDKSIELNGGYIIRPIKSMPDSRDKEFFLNPKFQSWPHPSPQPRAAITKACNVKKIVNEHDPIENQSLNIEFWNAQRMLYTISLILNVLDDVSCLGYYSTSYPSKETPFGPFVGSGGGSSIYDVIGHSLTKIIDEDRFIINDLIYSYESLSDKEKDRMQRILFRLSQAKRRDQIADKILDLGISMEMLLLQDNPNNEQLSLSFRLRGSWLLGNSPKEREKIYKQLKDIYKYRSQVAHSGVLCKGNPAKIENIGKKFPMYQSLAENICYKIIKEGNPDWSKIILDAS